MVRKYVKLSLLGCGVLLNTSWLVAQDVQPNAQPDDVVMAELADELGQLELGPHEVMAPLQSMQVSPLEFADVVGSWLKIGDEIESIIADVVAEAVIDWPDLRQQINTVIEFLNSLEAQVVLAVPLGPDLVNINLNVDRIYEALAILEDLLGAVGGANGAAPVDVPAVLGLHDELGAIDLLLDDIQAQLGP